MNAPVWDRTDRRRLVGLCATISGDREAAEDLAQETMYEAWRSAHKLSDDSAHEPWVNAIARNVCRRWARREGSTSVHRARLDDSYDVADDLDITLDLERSELVELLERALALLPSPTRAVLVARYLEGSSPAEIAARLGLSSDAVTMRVSRGRVMLRRVLETDLRAEAEPHLTGSLRPATGRRTAVWCTGCGVERLLMTVSAPAAVVSFECPHCTPGPAGRTHVFDLTNPALARLLRPVSRPTAILGRASQWADRYFLGPGASGAEDRRRRDCTRCGRPVTIERYRREGPEFTGGSQVGLYADCGSCHAEVSSSLAGLALAQPTVHTFRRRHPRVAALPLRRVSVGGWPALVVGYRAVDAAVEVEVVFDERRFDVVGARSRHGRPFEAPVGDQADAAEPAAPDIGRAAARPAAG